MLLADLFFSVWEDSNITTPIFVTALSSNHFQENLDLQENINTVVRPVMGNIKIIVYDLGINKTEREKVSRFKGVFDLDAES